MFIMRYPEYPADLDRRQPLTGLLRLFAQLEGGVSSDTKRLTWSQHIAEMSRLHYNGEKQRFRKRLGVFKSVNGVPQLYGPLHASIKFLNNHNELIRLQRKQHGIVVEELRTWDKNIANAGDYARASGRMTELVALGLLNRYGHPWILAAPALPHHEGDATKVAKHFDIALAIGNQGDDEAYALQIKKACSGRCGETAYHHDQTHVYMPAIQIVSGCCDLGIKTNEGMINSTVVDLLVAEYDERAAAADIKWLDELTDNLLFNISADLLPRGTVPMRFAHVS